MSRCYGHWELDLEVDGITVPLCARYGGQGTEVFRECKWCCWNNEEDDGIRAYGQGGYHRDMYLAGGMEWK